jgi:hypothetical protein
MHGIEHRRQKRRTIRLSAPRWPFSPALGSMLPGSPLAASCPEPVARNDFSLARNGCRLSATSIPGSKLPACYFASFQVGFRARSACRLHYRVPVCAGCGGFTASGPLHFHHPVRPAAPAISAPLRPFSPASRSMLPGSPLAASCPEPVARNGLSLSRNGCRLSAASIPGSMLSACYFASFQVRFRARSAFWLHYRSPPVCAGGGRFIAWGPLHFHFLVQPAAPAISTPLRDFCLPRDQSVQPLLLPAGPPDESARFPLAPRRPSW